MTKRAKQASWLRHLAAVLAKSGWFPTARLLAVAAASCRREAGSRRQGCPRWLRHLAAERLVRDGKVARGVGLRFQFRAAGCAGRLRRFAAAGCRSHVGRGFRPCPIRLPISRRLAAAGRPGRTALREDAADTSAALLSSYPWRWCRASCATVGRGNSWQLAGGNGRLPNASSVTSPFRN